jgi:hypothetical protein
MDFSAHSIIWTILVGLVIGAIAKLLMPGKDPGGCIVTILLGIAGALVHLDWSHLCGRKLRRRLDHVGRRRNDPAAAVSIAFQAWRVSRVRMRLGSAGILPVAASILPAASPAL